MLTIVSWNGTSDVGNVDKKTEEAWGISEPLAIHLYLQIF